MFWKMTLYCSAFWLSAFLFEHLLCPLPFVPGQCQLMQVEGLYCRWEGWWRQVSLLIQASGTAVPLPLLCHPKDSPLLASLRELSLTSAPRASFSISSFLFFSACCFLFLSHAFLSLVTFCKEAHSTFLLHWQGEFHKLHCCKSVHICPGLALIHYVPHDAERTLNDGAIEAAEKMLCRCCQVGVLLSVNCCPLLIHWHISREGGQCCTTLLLS